MKIKLVFAFSFFSFFIFGQNNTLVVTTLNCEFLNSKKIHIKYGYPLRLRGDAKLLWDSTEYRMKKYHDSADSIAIFLAELNSDVFALTEVGSEDDVKYLFKKVKALNSAYKFFEVAESKDNVTGQNVAIISKIKMKKLIKNIPGREFYISEEDDAEEIYDTGISKGMRAEFQFNNKDFIIYVFHFVSERSGHKEDQQRVAQASIARRHMINDLMLGKHIIIAGDFNDHRGQPTLMRLRGLDDIYEDFIQTGDLKYFEEEKYGTRWTHEFRGERRQIDHILLALNIKNICRTRKGIKAFSTFHNRFISDHNAWSVVLNLK